MDKLFWEDIDNLLNKKRDYEILHDRFVLGKTLREVGKDRGIHAERVRQIEARALRTLRHPKLCKELR